MTWPVATVSPVSRLISTRSAKIRDAPRVISTRPVAMRRFGATCSMWSATTPTSPPLVLTTAGTATPGVGTVGGWAAAEVAQARAATATIVEAPRVVGMADKSSSEKGLHAISPLFDRARFITPSERSQHLAHEEQGARDTNDGSPPRIERQR